MKKNIILLLAMTLSGCGGHYVHMSSNFIDLGDVASSLCNVQNEITDVTAIYADEVEMTVDVDVYSTNSGLVMKSYDCQKRSKIIVPAQPRRYYNRR